MHELSIALSILDIAAEEAESRGGARVDAIYLKLGPLSGVAKEALLSAYDLAREVSPMALTRLVIEDAPLVVFCPTCNCDRPAMSIQELCCSRCGTFTADVVSGRELEIVGLEVES